jgi:molybdenum cofactor cytidylyltransferase
MTNSTTAIIILAAGRSSRLGLPKQLLQFKEKSLLRHVAETALAAQPAEVVGILGFEADRMKHELDDLPVRVLTNAGWEEGIASSIREGITSLPTTLDGALLMLCDQPFVTSDLLRGLISTCTSTIPIAATGYDESAGVPACFNRSLFHELLELRGDVGAKRVIGRHRDKVTTIVFPEASIDIDTISDYRKHLTSGR